MMPAMYAAISGLDAHQGLLDVTANNLANIDTIGYKAQRMTFVNSLTKLLSGGSGQTDTNGGTNPEQIGLGVQIGSIDNIMSAGLAREHRQHARRRDPGQRLPRRRQRHAAPSASRTHDRRRAPPSTSTRAPAT